ncbi:hypothetical protein D3C81_2260630 [compost metagenome]
MGPRARAASSVSAEVSTSVKRSDMVSMSAESTILPSRMNSTSVRMCSTSSTWWVVMMMVFCSSK